MVYLDPHESIVFPPTSTPASVVPGIGSPLCLTRGTEVRP